MSVLASGTWLTPFGVPFDTAVIIGLALTVLSIVLAGRAEGKPVERDGGDR
ncbi:hypothetical protein ACFS2C_10440 [Prauserella oleivorans]|uniref:Uncharacterized protein n=1 Tax=Prauserella oleivorans TaxID=1478153 RepID=A0ABW5WBU2_9PSEU